MSWRCQVLLVLLKQPGEDGDVVFLFAWLFSVSVWVLGVAVVCCWNKEKKHPQLELWENVKLESYSSVKQVAKLSATLQEQKVIPSWCKRSGRSDAFLKFCYVFLPLNDKTKELSVKGNRASIVAWWAPNFTFLSLWLDPCLLLSCSFIHFSSSLSPGRLPLLPSVKRRLCVVRAATPGWLKFQFN